MAFKNLLTRKINFNEILSFIVILVLLLSMLQLYGIKISKESGSKEEKIQDNQIEILKSDSEKNLNQNSKGYNEENRIGFNSADKVPKQNTWTEPSYQKLSSLAGQSYNYFDTSAFTADEINVTDNPNSQHKSDVTTDNLGRLWVVFDNDTTVTNTNGEIWAVYSTDNGSTFSSPIQLTNNAGVDRSPNIVTDFSGNLWVFWFSERTATNWDIWYKNSSNNGLTWSQDYQLTSLPGNEYDARTIVNQYGEILVFYTYDDQSTSNDIYYSKHFTNNSWSTPIKVPISTSNREEIYSAWISQNGSIYLYVQELSSLWGVNVWRSSDGGITWSSYSATSYSNYVWGGLFESNGTVHVLYATTSNVLYYINSTDLSTWTSPVQLTTSGFVPQFHLDDLGTLFMTYTSGKTGNDEVFLKRFFDFSNPKSSLLAYYDFNEGSGTILIDKTGNGKNGTISGSVFSTSLFGTNSLNFNGLNNRVSLPAINSWIGNELTIDVWVKPTGLTTSVYRDILRQSGSLGTTWNLAFQNSGTILSFGLYAGGIYNELDVPITSTDYTDGYWHHILAIYNGTHKILVVDDLVIGINSQSGLINFGTFTYHYIGSGTVSEWFQGQIDELKIFNRALPTREFKFTFLDDFEDGDIGDWNPSGSWTVETGKLKTNGGDPNLFAPINVSGNWEASFDIYWISGAYFEGHIITDANFTSTPQNFWRMYMTTYSGQRLVIDQMQLNPTNVQTKANIAMTVSQSTWYHFKVKRIDTTLFYYLNQNLIHVEENAVDLGNQFAVASTNAVYFDNYTIKYNEKIANKINYAQTYVDDFNDGDISDWFLHNTTGSWTVIGGKLSTTRSFALSGNYPELIAPIAVIGDYEVSVDMNWVSGGYFEAQLWNDYQYGGTSPTYTWSSHLSSNGNEFAVMYYQVHPFGGGTKNGSSSQTISTGTWFNFKTVRQGTTLTYYLNDVALHTVNGAQDPGNHFALNVASEASVYFDNFTVKYNTLMNTPPTASNLQVNPSLPTTLDDLQANWTYSDVDTHVQQQPIIRWYKNAIFQPSLNDSLVIASSNTQKGELWYYTLNVFDGFNYSSGYTSPTITILNSAPTASNLQLTSPAFTTDNLVSSFTFSDVDNDVLSSYIIHWYKNGILIPSLDNLTSISASLTLKGEVWNYTLQVYDGEALSSLYYSPSITVLNSIPILSNVNLISATQLDSLNATWTYSDADGDTMISFTINWYKDTVLQSGLMNLTSVPSSYLSKNDQWYYTVEVFDGEDTSSLYTSPTRTIANIAPTPTSLTISPTVPFRGDPLFASYTYYDEDGDVEVSRIIRWYKNGVENTSLINSTSVPGLTVFKGDTWYFTLQSYDGQSLSSVYTSASVMIRNSVPTASNLLLTSSANTTTPLTASWTYQDVDDDPQSSFTILWYKNGVLQSSLNDLTSISSSYTLKGDQWYYSLQVSDGFNFSIAYSSLTITIQNSIPTVVNLQLTSPARDSVDLTASWSYQDADSDPLSGYQISWYINGLANTTFDNMSVIPNSYTQVGDTWMFSIRVHDGEIFSIEYNSSIVTIQSDDAPVFESVPENFSYIEGNTGYSVIWNASDNNPSTYEIYHNGQLNISSTWSSNTFISFSVDGLSIGLHNVSIVLFDGDSNSISHSVFITVRPVPVAPILEVYPSNFTTTQGYGNISWLATDDNPSTYLLLKNGSVFDSNTWSSGILVDIDISSVEIGNYIFTIIVFDNDGLNDSIMFSVTITPPPSPPVIVISPIDHNYEANMQGNISWVVTDDNPSNYTLFIDNNPYNSDQWISGELTDIIYSGQTAGVHNFTIVFRDYDGYSTVDTVFVTMESAGTIPSIVSLPDNTNFIEVSVGNLSWKFSDDNPDTFVVYKDGGLFYSGNWFDNVLISFPIEGLTPGIYNFTIQVRDLDDNLVSSTVEVTVNEKTKEAPVISTKPSDIFYTEGSTGNFVNWVATDDNPSTYIIYLDGSEYTTGTWNSGGVIAIQVDNLTPGSHDIQIVVKDLDDLTATDTVTITVKSLSSSSATSSSSSSIISTTPFFADFWIMFVSIFSLLPLKFTRNKKK